MQLSMTLSDLERSNRGQAIQRAVTWKPLQIRLNLLLMMDRKSYTLSFVTINFDQRHSLLLTLTKDTLTNGLCFDLD